MTRTPIRLALGLALAFAAGTALAQTTTTTRTTVTTPAGAGAAMTTDGSMPMPMVGAMGDKKMATNKMDRMFIMMANQGNMTEIKASEMAATKAMNADVKAFASQMVTDHTAAGEKLMPVAMAHGVTLATTLDAKHQAGVNKLMKTKSGMAFDKAYVMMMVKDHDMTVAMFEKAANDPKCAPDVKQFASDTLPTLREHQTRIKEIQASMMKG